MLLETIRHEVLQNPSDFVAACEADYNKKIDDIATVLAANRKTRPIVLLSGPSGSGKTTTAHRLAHRLASLGIKMHIVSMDNYFRTFTEEEQMLFRDHRLDLESPDRMDKNLLTKHMEAIMRGETVTLPHFNFTTNVAEFGEETLRLSPNEMIILEGIHALNPNVLGSTDRFTTRIYVSVRTRIEYVKQGIPTLLHPSMVRLARRMIRDRRERGRTFSDVVALYAGVENGEKLYIMPYKHRADLDIDTFIPYELCAYRDSLPSAMPNEQETYPWLCDLFDVLNSLPSLDTAILPSDALIREFVGK